MSQESGGDERYVVSDEVVREEIEGEVMLLDLEGDEYFSMNRSGAAIWDRLEEGASVGAIIDDLCQRFDLERQRAARDVREFVERARQGGLIERRSSGESE